MRSDKKTPLRSDKKSPPKIQKKGTLGYNKKSALLEDAITQMNAGKYGRASSALKDLLALDPLNAEARRLFATLHLRLGSLMSARTAFESLAREAMERQDYWLAESLLREYLTAGPRCVPFLEMLGHVYEEKGDVMAAVAEYGKAIEVLLEDPDSEHPNRASELFGKIRSLAPGSPVAFRFAAMFDTVTGQVLQTIPQPAMIDSGAEPADAPSKSKSPVDAAATVAMPWEQIESTPTDAAVSGEVQAPTVGESIEAKTSVDQLVSEEPVARLLGQSNALDSTPAMSAADSPLMPVLQPSAEFSSLSVAPPTDLVQVACQNDPTVDDSTLPILAVVEDAKPAIEVLAHGSSQPITEKPMSPVPMPWDQVEEAALPISPVAASEFPEATEVAPTLPVAAVLPVPPVAKVQEFNIEAPAEGSRHSLAESMGCHASLPLEQDDDAVPMSSPVTDSDGSMDPEVGPPLSCQAEPPPPTLLETVTPTIEVLRTSSVHPIAEAPMSPAPMPWDQNEETARASSTTAESTEVVEGMKVEEAPDAAAVDPLPQAEAMPDSPVPPVSSFTSSSGLSWEDILAAVAAMQASPAFPQAQSLAESEASIDMAASEETATTVSSAADPLKTDWWSYEPPASSSVAGLMGDPPLLSAPMPWEQIEVDDLAILRQDPEPEFGPLSAEAVGGGQDPTVIMPVAGAVNDLVPMAEVPANESIADCLIPHESLSTPMFRILSPDAPIESRAQPLPIHIPAEAFEQVEESAGADISEPEPGTEPSVDLPAERPLRLAGSEAIAESEQSQPAATEPSTEAVEAASQATPLLTIAQSLIEDTRTLIAHSMEVILSNSPSVMDQPAAHIAGHEPTKLTTLEPVVEAAVPSVATSFIPDQPVVQAEQIAVISEIAPMEENVEPASEPERPPPLVQNHAFVPDGVGGEAEASRLSELVAEGDQTPNEAVLPVSEGGQAPSADAVIAVHLNESNLASVESMQPGAAVMPAPGSEELTTPVAGREVIVPPAASAPAVSTNGSLRILWDDSSPKPTPSVSTGNMLTRWLSKPKDLSPPEIDRPATIPDEPVTSLAPPVGERREAAPILTDGPVDRSDDSTSLHTAQPATRPTSSKPAVGQAWRHISRAATSLIGAGVSTTRSLVVLIVALLGFTLAVLAGCVGAVALVWALLEEQPTPAYRTMTSVPQHTLPDSQKNGYFLLLGFDAAPTQDPVQAGIDRRAEQADRAVALTCLTGQGNGSGSQQGASADVAGKWLKTVDPAAQMRMEAAGVKSWASQAKVAMGRYRQWLSNPFEDWGYGQPISPNCGVILYAHRLYVAEGFAQDVAAGVARLETDLIAWRSVFGQARTMPIKMLASDALNDDIAVISGLLLRPDLDDRLISRLAKVARPLDQTEQSIRWPMQSQFVLATKQLEESINQDPADARPFYGSVAAALPVPRQRRLNAYAQYYETVAKAAAEGRYADLPKQSQFVRTPPYGPADLLMNPIESLIGIDPLPTWETYAGRVMETDARLRLASLQAWLRRTPPEQDLLTRVAKAGQGFYDPFTGFPMLINIKKGAFYSVGRDLQDNEAQDRLDVVVQIPLSAWAGGKRMVDTMNDSK